MFALMSEKIWVGVLIVAASGLLSQSSQRIIEIVPTHYLSEIAEARQEPVALSPSPTPLPSPKEYLESKTSGDVALFRLANVIVNRESGWQPDICNKTTIHGCDAGQGLFQIIPSTEKTCEEHFNREMDMLTAYDNIDCGMWLLTANGIKRGIQHWDDMSWTRDVSKSWGSGPYKLKDFGIE
ncbi:MAG: transglycosylase [Podoviridae sp. ctviO18]|nr:MAG: transglycosylase [Podoviridae sp. ctviO18]